MRFSVYAGNMYCGKLTVTCRGLHIFRDRSGALSSSIYGYKNLKLLRRDSIAWQGV